MAQNVSWADVQPIADEAFHIWVGNPELQWAERAWRHLAEAGLAEGGTSLERLQVYVRFMVLASLYRDWCALVWDEIQDDSPEVWLSAVHVSAVHIGQLLGPDEDFEEEEFGEALNVLMGRERTRVVEALLKGFRGVEGLYISLWLSNGDIDFENEEQEHINEIVDDLINAYSDLKMAAFNWVEEGCPSRGPVRVYGEMDD